MPGTVGRTVAGGVLLWAHGLILDGKHRTAPPRWTHDSIGDSLSSTVERPVLVTGGTPGHDRSALAAVRALRQGGYAPAVTVEGPGSLAASSRDCAERLRTPPQGHPEYAQAVRSLVAARGFLAVLPTSDAALLALQHPGARLVDKSWLAVRAQACGFPGIPTRRFAALRDLQRSADDLDYPCVVKAEAKQTSGAGEAQRVDAPRDLAALTGFSGAVLVQPWLAGGLRAVAGVAWKGTLVTTVHQRYLRTWPVGCGVAAAAVTVDPDTSTERRLGALLADYSGVFQAQLIGDHLLDLNPRVYGSLPLALAAGANLPALYCDLVAGLTPPPPKALVGVRYRWVEGDLRHVLAQVRARRMRVPEALGALAPRAGTAHSIVALRDLRPMWTRLRFVAVQAWVRSKGPGPAKR